MQDPHSHVYLLMIYVFFIIIQKAQMDQSVLFV